MLYLETIDYPRCNKLNGRTVYPIKQDNIDEANAIFKYAKQLIAYFDGWDKDDLPNPEKYLAENRNNVEQTNLFYTEAVKFILCHEFTHLKLHSDKITSNTAVSHYLEFEKEADENALKEIKKGINYVNSPIYEVHRFAVEGGVVIAILSTLFFSAVTEGTKHPNIEDRLTFALEFLELDADHFAWEIACVGIKLWEEQFDLNFNWGETQAYGKKQYYEIIKQIKTLNI